MFQNVIPLLHLVPDPRIFNILIRKLPLTSEDLQAQKKSLSMQNCFWGAGLRIKPLVWQNRGSGTAAENGGSGSTCCPAPHGTPCAPSPALPGDGATGSRHPGSSGTPKAPWPLQHRKSSPAPPAPKKLPVPLAPQKLPAPLASRSNQLLWSPKSNQLLLHPESSQLRPPARPPAPRQLLWARGFTLVFT